MSKTDALAVIDLAEACNMFNGVNYKAAGICYNNIANIQYKNEKFGQAAENFFHAVKMAEICLLIKTPKEVYEKLGITTEEMRDPEKNLSKQETVYFQKVLAHRTYQYAMSIYKELRYKNGGSRDRNLTWNKVDAWFRQAIALYKDIPGPYKD